MDSRVSYRRDLEAVRAVAHPARVAVLEVLREPDSAAALCRRSRASGLIDHATESGEHMPSASVEAEIGFESAEARARFLDEYLTLLESLLERYGESARDAASGRYRVALALYPDLDPAEPDR